jgi:hypothetical protein
MRHPCARYAWIGIADRHCAGKHEVARRVENLRDGLMLFSPRDLRAGVHPLGATERHHGLEARTEVHPLR